MPLYDSFRLSREKPGRFLLLHKFIGILHFVQDDEE